MAPLLRRSEAADGGRVFCAPPCEYTPHPLAHSVMGGVAPSFVVSRGTRKVGCTLRTRNKEKRFGSLPCTASDTRFHQLKVEAVTPEVARCCRGKGST
ncbi:hypothetical protein IscW_ISCW014206 [Ixodes scapularis]|uniref:Uncharacterized protein n=1 Tax=Ixodes scapularis TaxID=6945 RepID=B7QI48_IXOSC|nr:hypothetical protein IscW_ISCW014206 [Ixodes scapularis]|eukprot:XP_002414855.1 hypothetical protein IscW_ISCW014206 [Ixodes scapularis]